MGPSRLSVLGETAAESSLNMYQELISLGEKTCEILYANMKAQRGAYLPWPNPPALSSAASDRAQPMDTSLKREVGNICGALTSISPFTAPSTSGRWSPIPI